MQFSAAGVCWCLLRDRIDSVCCLGMDTQHHWEWGKKMEKNRGRILNFLCIFSGVESEKKNKNSSTHNGMEKDEKSSHCSSSNAHTTAAGDQSWKLNWWWHLDAVNFYLREFCDLIRPCGVWEFVELEFHIIIAVDAVDVDPNEKAWSFRAVLLWLVW